MNKVYPQERAELIGKNGCLAFCYLYCMGLEPDDAGASINLISRAIDKGYGIADDASVSDANLFFFKMSGREVVVTKKKINTIKDIIEPTPVLFTAAGYIPHWVVVANGEIVFNSIPESKSVKYGVPTDARIITLKP